ncbi:MAG: hypothetical protein ACO3JL_21880, partial [Myxococcota bacterium]
LDAAEVDATTYVCNGANGISTLVSRGVEFPSANCPYGGARFDYGLDDGLASDGVTAAGIANDGVLDIQEIDSSSYDCEPAPEVSFTSTALVHALIPGDIVTVAGRGLFYTTEAHVVRLNADENLDQTFTPVPVNLEQVTDTAVRVMLSAALPENSIGTAYALKLSWPGWDSNPVDVISPSFDAMAPVLQFGSINDQVDEDTFTVHGLQFSASLLREGTVFAQDDPTTLDKGSATEYVNIGVVSKGDALLVLQQPPERFGAPGQTLFLEFAYDDVRTPGDDNDRVVVGVGTSTGMTRDPLPIYVTPMQALENDVSSSMTEADVSYAGSLQWNLAWGTPTTFVVLDVNQQPKAQGTWQCVGDCTDG